MNLFAPALLALSLASAHAATLPVTNNNDSGPGSLRAQVAASGPGDTITFDPAVTGKIVLTSGQIQITHALTITGNGVTIDGNGTDRIFHIAEPGGGNCPVSGSDYLVSISFLGLTNAQRHTDNTGGAIHTFKSLSLDRVAIFSNIAKAGGGVSFLTQYPGQSLSITNSIFLGNLAKPLSVVTTGNNGGALYIAENCPDMVTGNVDKTIPFSATISHSLFSSNRAQPVSGNGLPGRAGAIFANAYGDITITDSRIVDNHVDVPTPDDPTLSYQGGGIRSYAKSLTIQRTEISNNTVFDATANNLTRGGGLFLFNTFPNVDVAPADAMAVKIVDSTISGNRVTDLAGAILVNGNVALELDNTTISDNAAGANRTGGIFVSTGAPAAAPTLTMTSSILANSLPASTTDLAGNAVSIPSFTVNADHSLIEKICAPGPGCSTITVSGSGNLTATDPMLDSLDFNGGLTRTQPPRAGSPVIDAGSNPLALATDQRGAPRVAGSTADMGAYELVAFPPVTGLIPDGSSLQQTFGPYPDTKWFALDVEPGKTYVIEAADVSGDLSANAIGTLGIFDQDLVSPPPEANVDCTGINGPRPPAVDVASDGIRCVLRTAPPTFPTVLNKRPVVVKVTRMDPATGGSKFRIRAREATIYGRWLTTGYDYHVEVENTTADAMCVEVAAYPASGLTYSPYYGWLGNVGTFTMNVPAFGAVKNVTPAGTKVGSDTEGTFRIGACASPLNLIPGALHVSSFAFDTVASRFIYFFTTTANEGKTRSTW